MNNKPDSTVTKPQPIANNTNKGVASVLAAQWHDERTAIKPRKTTLIPYPEESSHKQFEQKIAAELRNLGLKEANHAQGVTAPGYSINPGEIGLLIHVSQAEFKKTIAPQLKAEQDEQMPAHQTR